MDYQGLYGDVLQMELRAQGRGLLSFAESCRQFRLDLLMRFYSPIGHYRL